MEDEFDELAGGFFGFVDAELSAEEELAVKEAVAARLRRFGYDAGVWQSGGGVHVVAVRMSGGREWDFGTAGETWGGGLYVDGEPAQGADVWTDVPSNSRDAERIALALINAMERQGA